MQTYSLMSMRRLALIGFGSCLALAVLPTSLVAKGPLRSVLYSFVQYDNYIVISLVESPSGVAGTVMVNRYFYGGRYKKSFKVSQAEFDRICAMLNSPGVEKHLINEKSERRDMSDHYVFSIGDRNYAVYRYGASPTVSELASQLRAYGDRAIDEGIPSLPEVYGAKLVDFGVYQIHSTGKVQRADPTKGAWEVVPSEQLIEKTDTIPARINTNFGIRYTITGLPKGGQANITIQVTHPPIVNPRTGKATTVEKHTLPLRIGITDYRGVTFKTRSDIVPGPWVFEVFIGHDLLLKKKFKVTAAS
jgi:hypothetical protein